MIEFKNISKQQLCSYLSNDQLKADTGEIEVFRATLEWFEANRSAKEAGDETDLADLMQHVRFPQIPSYSLLNEIMTSQIISKNPELMRMVSEALLFHSNDKVFLQPLQEGKHFQPRGEQMLALIKSTSRREGQSYITDDTKLHMIRGTSDKPFHTEVSEQVLPMTLYPRSLCVVTKGNYLFLFGADATYFRPMAVRFDVKTNTWLDLKPPPYKASVRIPITLLKDNIYLLGGFDLKDNTNLKVNPNLLSECASQYSIETNSWSTLKNLPRGLAFHSTAS